MQVKYSSSTSKQALSAPLLRFQCSVCICWVGLFQRLLGNFQRALFVRAWQLSHKSAECAIRFTLSDIDQIKVHALLIWTTTVGWFLTIVATTSSHWSSLNQCKHLCKPINYSSSLSCQFVTFTPKSVIWALYYGGNALNIGLFLPSNLNKSITIVW